MDILSNKYFTIAILIALIVILFLYSQKKSCYIEGMKNNDLTLLTQEFEKPNITTDRPLSIKQPKKRDFRKKKKYKITGKIDHSSGIPRPLDDRPDLSQCQPCICPKDNYSSSSEDIKSRRNKHKKFKKYKKIDI